jgi:hypothetical protein
LDEFGSIPTTAQEAFAPSLFWSEPLQFSAMSDDQIIDAVHRAGSAFGASVPDVPLDDMMSWDWFDTANPDFNF